MGELDYKPERTINFKNLSIVMRTPTLSPLAKCVIMDLLLYAGKKGEAFPSEISLGDDLGVTDRHIRNVLKELKDAGWIVDWHKRGFSKSNEYTLNPELYYQNESYSQSPIEKSTSSQRGTPFPDYSGNPFPPNKNNKLNSKNEIFNDFSLKKSSDFKKNYEKLKATVNKIRKKG